MIKIVFFTLFLVVLGLMNLYTYRRFLAKLSFVQEHKAFARYFLYTLTILIALFLSSTRYDLFDQKLLWFFAYAIGVLFMLFVSAAVYDLLHISFAKVSYDAQRRRFMKVAFDVTFLIMTFSYLLKGVIDGLKEPILRRVLIKIKNFGAGEFKIVQLSDVHIGNTIKKAFVEATVKRVNALKPDLIVLTGDLTDADIERIVEDVAPLKDLKATHGVHFVLGNHEYFHDPLKTMVHLKTLNINVLENDSCLIADRFNLVGLTDYHGTRVDLLAPDLPKAFAQTDPMLPTIVLAHQPKMVKPLEAYKPDLILSGHTHGGQIFPFGLLVLLDQPYLGGLYRHDASTQIFVSKGTGFWGPPIRLLADSEIVEITIKGA